MADISKLEQQAELLADRIAEWELFMVALICKEIGRIGKMKPEQARKYNAKKETNKTEKIITSALTTAVLLNIKDLPNTYTDVFDEIHKESQYMYKYKGIPFVDLADDKATQKIINQYAKKNGADLLDFTKTKAIKVLDADGNPVALRKEILKSFDDASKLIIDGKSDFYSSMRKSVLELGGSGARVEYPNGLTRRLDTVVRSNMLYNGKLASRDYSRKIGDELGCDGIEVSFSTNPRPSHRFMEGKQYAKKHGKTVNGIYYQGAEDEGVYERLYEDYNCNHREKQIILGVSEPTYSAEELARLKAENEKQFTIGNSTGDGYFWSQRMRSLESATRKAKGQINSLEALGDAESKAKAKELRKRVKLYRQKYNEICNVTGMEPDLNRMSVPRLTKK